MAGVLDDDNDQQRATTMTMTRIPARHRLPLFLLAVVCTTHTLCTVRAQQSAAGQDTLIGIVGRDFVMLGADSSSSGGGGGGIALTSMNVDKIAIIHDGGWTGGMRRRRLGRMTEECDMPSHRDDDDDDDHFHLSQSSRHDRSAYFARQSLEQQAIVVGLAGDMADADRFVGMLKTHVQVREYEAGIGNDVVCVFDGRLSGEGASTKMMMSAAVSVAGMDVDAIANLSRNEISSRMRSRQPLQLCLLVAGMVRCHQGHVEDASSNTNANMMGRVQKQILSSGSARYNPMKTDLSEQNGRIIVDSSISSPEFHSLTINRNDHRLTSNPFLLPKLFWLDQYGSIQDMRYAAHGYGSNFAYSILDQRYHGSMSRQEAADLIQNCFEQLRQRYVINSPNPPRIKCIDEYGVTEVLEGKNKR